MLDRDQDVDPPERDGVHGHEVHGEDDLGLGGKELAPGWTRSTRGGINASVVQNLLHRGGSDAMAGPDQFALHAPMSSGGVLCCHAHHEVLDCRCGGWPSWLAACGVVPLP